VTAPVGATHKVQIRSNEYRASKTRDRACGMILNGTAVTSVPVGGAIGRAHSSDQVGLDLAANV
jgi:hypothetical protein